ncbi:MAG: hypothetical protein ACE5NP_04030 [Anaerolineae bacterium]
MASLPRKLQAALDAVRASADDGECRASLAELARPLGNRSKIRNPRRKPTGVVTANPGNRSLGKL